DSLGRSIYETVKPFTVTGPAAVFTLCDAVRYVVRAKIPGAFVECGVFMGGSSMAAALAAKQTGRRFWDQSRERPSTSISRNARSSCSESTTADAWWSRTELIVRSRDRLGVWRHKTLPPYLTRAASHILELKTKRARIRRLEPQVCRIKLQPVVALEPGI